MDYANFQTLVFALRGVDVVISTVVGPNQLLLIQAAVAAGVRKYVAAEFEGLPHLRPPNDPLDRDRTAARQLLESHAQRMQHTSCICGVLYERFQPGGLRQSSIGKTSGFDYEAAFMTDCRNMQAEAPIYDASGRPRVTMCLTAAQDVARFVTRALSMPSWPTELRMCGQRVTVADLIATVEQLMSTLGQPQNTSSRKLTLSQGNDFSQIRRTAQPPCEHSYGLLPRNRTVRD